MSNAAQSPNSIMLTATDLKAAIAFYLDVCGFELKESWPQGDSPMRAKLCLDGQSVMMGSPMAPDKAEAKPGDMYCNHCLSEDGKLKPFDEILEGTIQGYFISMQKMERAEAEVAAKELLAKMPAWSPETCS